MAADFPAEVVLRINSQSAQEDLAALSKALDVAGASMSKMDRAFSTATTRLDASLTRATASMGRYVDLVATLDKAKLASNPAASIMQITAALDGLSGARGVSSGRIANLEKLGKALAALRPTPGLAALGRDLAGLSNFKGPSKTAVNNVRALLAVLAEAKSIPAVNAMAANLNTVANAAARVNTAFATMPAKLRAFSGAQSEANAITRRTASGVSSLSLGLGGLASRFTLAGLAGSAFNGILAAMTIGEFARGIFETSVQFQALTKALLFASGSFSGAAQATQSYLDIEQRLGLSIKENISSYGKFTVSARTAGLSLQESNEIYSGIETGLVATGASAVQAQRALYAIQQSLSIGKIQARQFSRELSLTLPASAYLGAQALSKITGQTVSMGQFFDYMRKGLISSGPFLKAFAAEVKDTFGALMPLASARPDIALNRLSNSAQILLKTISESGVGKTIAASIDSITSQIVTTGPDGIVRLTQSAQNFAKEIGSEFSGAIRDVGQLLAFLARNVNLVDVAVKAFIAYKVVGVFLSWQSSIIGVTTKLWGLVPPPSPAALAAQKKIEAGVQAQNAAMALLNDGSGAGTATASASAPMSADQILTRQAAFARGEYLYAASPQLKASLATLSNPVFLNKERSGNPNADSERSLSAYKTIESIIGQASPAAAALSRYKETLASIQKIQDQMAALMAGPLKGSRTWLSPRHGQIAPRFAGVSGLP